MSIFIQKSPKLLNDRNFILGVEIQFFELSQKIIKHIILGAKIQTRISIFFINFQKKSSKIYSKYFNILNFHKKKSLKIVSLGAKIQNLLSKN